MYEKKDIIVSSTMGLCVVADVTKLSADKKSPIPYYVLKAFYDRSKAAYIPVENHEVELRDPMSKEEAAAEFEALKEKIITDADYIPDELVIGELAYVLDMKLEEIKEALGLIGEDEDDNS